MSISVMTSVWRNATDIGGSDLLALLALADFASDDGDSCYPSISVLASKTRLTKKGTLDCIKRLEAKGYITINRRSHRKHTASRGVQLVNEYQINLECLKVVTKSDHVGSGRGNNDAADVVTMKGRRGNNDDAINRSVIDPLVHPSSAVAVVKTQPAIAACFDRWQLRHGELYGRPASLNGRHAKNFSDILKHASTEDVCAAIDAYFKTADPFVLEKHHLFGLFVSQIDMWLTADTTLTLTGRAALPKHLRQVMDDTDKWVAMMEAKEDI